MKTFFEADDIKEFADRIIESLKPQLKQLAKNNMIDDCYLDIEQTAQLLGVDPSWLYNNHRKLDIPSHKLGGHIRFSKTEVLSWAKKQ